MENNTKHTQCGINNIREAAKEKSLEYSSPDEQSIAFFSFEAGAKEQSEKDKVIIDKLKEDIDNLAADNNNTIFEIERDRLRLKEDNALLLDALKELLRFNRVMEDAADNLQYPDNYLKAIENCKQEVLKAESK